MNILKPEANKLFFLCVSQNHRNFTFLCWSHLIYAPKFQPESFNHFCSFSNIKSIFSWVIEMAPERLGLFYENQFVLIPQWSDQIFQMRIHKWFLLRNCGAECVAVKFQFSIICSSFSLHFTASSSFFPFSLICNWQLPS